MNQKMYASGLVATCVALTATLACWVGGVPMESVVGPSGIGAVALGAAGALLATFTGCRSIPSQSEFAELQGRLKEQEERYEKEDKKLATKTKEQRKLVAQIAELTNVWVVVTKGEAQQIQALADKLKALSEKIDEEKKDQADTVDGIIDTGQKAIDKANKLKEQTGDQVGQSNFGNEGSSESHFVMGWDAYRDGLTAAQEEARVALAAKKEQAETVIGYLDTIGTNTAIIAKGIEGFSFESSYSQLSTLMTLANEAVEASIEALHMDFTRGLEPIDALLSYMIEQTGPTVAITHPEGANTARIQGKAVLHRRTVGRFDAGDILLLDLPAGMALTEPCRITSSSGVEYKACGNEAGSRSIAVHVEAVPDEGSRRIVVHVDQELVFGERGAAIGQARAWSLRRDVGTTLTVGKLPPC